MDLKDIRYKIRYCIFNPWTKYGLLQWCEMCGSKRFVLKSCMFYWVCNPKKNPECVKNALKQSDEDWELFNRDHTPHDHDGV
jgi:hypothetical protein